MHPRNHAITTPDKTALIIHPSGDSLSYRQLDGESNRIAHWLRNQGLQAGDTLALCLENCTAFFAIAWAAQRSGLFYVCISTKLNASEVNYIIRDSGARLFITSATLTALASRIEAPAGTMRAMIGAPIAGYEDFVSACAALPDTPISDEQAGTDMLYSSGTTGRPKGIRPSWLPGTAIDAPDGVAAVASQLLKAGQHSVYLCPAPLYHAAPLKWSMALLRLGATVVVLSSFDAEQTLAAIALYRITHAQFVPTHFVRLLKLPEAQRQAHDMRSLQAVVHAAAPCPVSVKEAMMAWWGPIIYEYYSGSENNGGTFIGPHDWLAHKGSVGRAIPPAVLHICDDQGSELPARREGLVYFANGTAFEYHNDPVKTAEARHAQGWTTLGDVGWMDENGWLYLTDRKSFMIISGGVNIYPQEIENVLIEHPKVIDAAVIGVPHEEMGEQVIAVVQPLKWSDAGDALAAELIAFCRAQLSHVKTPRRIDFMADLPRSPTGKLMKRLLRDQYAPNQGS